MVRHLEPFKKTTPTISSELQSLASGGITAAAIHTHFNAVQVITDTLGGAVGNNIVQANAVMGSQEAGESAVEAAKKALVEKENKIELEELMQAKANVKAEQSRGAWIEKYIDDSSFTSDIFRSSDESLDYKILFESTKYLATSSQESNLRNYKAVYLIMRV